MRVFLSWSGERSQLVAQLLKDWLACVIQAVDPWISSKDIDRGSLWFSTISQQLGQTTVGVICLTKENIDKPWILFEAGALAKGLNSSRVCTLLVDLQPSDVRDPLAQFNHTLPNKESLWQLIRTINNASENPMLSEAILSRSFDTYWPQFEASFAEIIASTKDSQLKPPTENEILLEILESTRGLSSRMRAIESKNSMREWTKVLSDSLHPPVVGAIKMPVIGDAIARPKLSKEKIELLAKALAEQNGKDDEPQS